MENTENVEKSVPTEGVKKKVKSLLKGLLGGVIGGLAAIILLFGYQQYLATQKNEIVTVDLKKITDQKRQEILEKYKGAYTDSNVKKAEEEIKAFTEKLQEGIKRVGAGRVVLLKDVVLTDSVDITDKLKKYIKNTPQENNEDK